MAWHKVIWSPCEVEYLKTHTDEPIMQLCIALAKSKSAVKKMQGELGNKKNKTKKCLPGNQGQRSKIGKRKDCNNQFFRSGWESNCFRLLRHLGEATLIQYEPTDFTFWQFGVKRGTVSYTPDFRVTWADGTYNWIEVKGGWLKPSDKTRIRRFRKYYPAEFERLVAITPGASSKTASFFNSEGVPIKWYYPEINKQYRKVISGWE